LAALSGAATHVLTVVVQEPERFPEALARDSDLDLVETATTQAVKFPFYVQRLDDVDPDLVAMPELSIAIPPENNQLGRVWLLYKFDPYAAFIEVVDDPPEFSAEGPGIFAFDSETMRSGAPTHMLVVQSRHD